MPTEPELKAKVSLDGTSWEAGMRQVQTSLKGFTGSLGEIKNQIAGAFTAGAIVEQTKKIIEFGSHIKDLSLKTGISTDALQEFDYAARLTGTSLDGFVTALKRLAISQVHALEEGGEPLIESFKTFGVTISDIRSKSPEQLFQKIGESVRTTALSSNQLASGVDLMGKSSDEVFPAMKEGLASIAEELRKIGGLMDSQMINKLDDLDDRMTKFVVGQRKGWSMVAVGAMGAYDAISKVVQVSGLGLYGIGKLVTGDKIGVRGVGDAITEIIHGKNPATDDIDIDNIKSASGMLLDPTQLKPSSHHIALSPVHHPQIFPNDANINEWQRHGAFVGGPGGDRMVLLTEKQVTLLTKIERNQRDKSAVSLGIKFPQ